MEKYDGIFHHDILLPTFSSTVFNYFCWFSLQAKQWKKLVPHVTYPRWHEFVKEINGWMQKKRQNWSTNFTAINFIICNIQKPGVFQKVHSVLRGCQLLVFVFVIVFFIAVLWRHKNWNQPDYSLLYNTKFAVFWSNSI